MCDVRSAGSQFVSVFRIEGVGFCGFVEVFLGWVVQSFPLGFEVFGGFLCLRVVGGRAVMLDVSLRTDMRTCGWKVCPLGNCTDSLFTLTIDEIDD